MINEKLKDKKLYISPAVEVMWIQSEGCLMEGHSVWTWAPDEEFEGEELGNGNGKANRFSFTNVLDSYDNSQDDPSSGFELPEF